MSIGGKIKQRRIELGLTQDELAIKLGYKSRSSINKIELGINDISQTNVRRFATALDTSVSYLMDWTDNASEDIVINKNIMTKSTYEKEEKKRIFSHILKLMERSCISYEVMSRLLGYDDDHIQNILNGFIDFDMNDIPNIANILGIDIIEVMNLSTNIRDKKIINHEKNLKYLIDNNPDLVSLYNKVRENDGMTALVEEGYEIDPKDIAEIFNNLKNKINKKKG